MRIISFFKKLFSKQEISRVPRVPNAEVTRHYWPVKSVAIIIGHGDFDSENNFDSGAKNWNGRSEFFEQDIVAKTIRGKVRTKKIYLCYRRGKGIKGVAKEALSYKPDLTIELHNNSFKGKAQGCEILTLKGDTVSISFAQDLAKKFCTKFNRKMRDLDGVKEVVKENGSYSLGLVSDPPPSILTELYFGDNKDDWIEPFACGEFLAEWIDSL